VIAVYVDDFLLFLSNTSHIRTVKEDLKRHFEMKDLEEASWMKIERSDMTLGVRTLSISQEQYVETILEWHGMTNSNPVKIPMIANLQLPSLTEAEIDITEYQRCIGSLMYLMVCTRPDIAYAVSVLSRHVTCQGMFTCKLSNVYFGTSEELVTSSSISRLMIPLHLTLRFMLIQTGLVIAQTGSPSLVMWD